MECVLQRAGSYQQSVLLHVWKVEMLNIPCMSNYVFNNSKR